MVMQAGDSLSSFGPFEAVSNTGGLPSMSVLGGARGAGISLTNLAKDPNSRPDSFNLASAAAPIQKAPAPGPGLQPNLRQTYALG